MKSGGKKGLDVSLAQALFQSSKQRSYGERARVGDQTGGCLRTVYFLFFKIEDAGAVFANNERLAKAYLIDELRPELQLAGAAAFAVHPDKGKPLFFLDDQVIEAASLGRDLSDDLFSGFFQVFDGLLQGFFLLTDFTLPRLIFLFDLLETFFFFAHFLFGSFNAVKGFDDFFFKKRIVGL